MTDDEAGQYELVVPFKICQSEGGPYDDDAFVSGFRLGQLDVRLEQLPVSDHRYITSLSTTIHQGPETDQLDLIAMNHNCSMTREELEDGWMGVTITKNPTHG